MRRGTDAALALGLAALLLHCSSDPSGPQEITQLPRVLDAAEEELIEADNAFGLKLFAKIHEQGEPGANIFISPLSVAMALGMTYNGAVGETQRAMQQTLELQGLTLPEVNQSYRSLVDLLRGLDPAVDFRIANSIWYDERYSFEQEFLDVNRDYFDAQVTGLDFASPGAAPTINAWVDEQTNGRITEIVEGPISPELVMFLINAIYFKGDWANPFDEERTRDSPFRLADGTEKQVPMMSYPNPDTVLAYVDGDVTVLDLAYGGKAYSVTIAMPEEPAGIGALVASLDSQTWERWIDGLEGTAVVVRLPKFTLEYELDMNDVLDALGMGIAFDPGNADFTKIYNGAAGRVYISKVKHKTFVDVNEKGTEAAAVTSVEVGITSIPPTISVDRPFVFAIRERLSGTVLFVGLVMDPLPVE
jgi:serine protease inhibitor